MATGLCVCPTCGRAHSAAKQHICPTCGGPKTAMSRQCRACYTQMRTKAKEMRTKAKGASSPKPSPAFSGHALYLFSRLMDNCPALIERERNILKRRFLQGQTLETIGEEFGVTKSRIQQIESKALRKLFRPRVVIKERLISKIFVEKDGKFYEKSGRRPITTLSLSARTFNCLMRNHTETVEELLVLSDKYLLGIRNFGQASLAEVKAALGTMYEEQPALGTIYSEEQPKEVA